MGFFSSWFTSKGVTSTNSSTDLAYIGMGQSSSSGWQDEINCERLYSYPNVRSYLESQRRTNNYMSADDFYKQYGKIMKSTFGTPSSLGVDVGRALAQRLVRQLGIKTGKERTEGIYLPCGKVLVAILAHLVHEGIELEAVEQFSEGCLLTCTVPSSLATERGEMEIGVGRQGSNTLVVAGVTFGQVFDWGRANKIIDKLFQAARAGV